jgi:hypothetical protein
MLTESMCIDVKNARPLTKAEIADRVAFTKRLSEALWKAADESPLPDDFLDYCKGRKFMTSEEP